MNFYNNPNLKFLIETLNDEPAKPLSKLEKAAFVDQVRRFSEMSDSIYGKGDLEELTELVRDMVKKAESIATEKGDWFDNLTVKRHMRQLHDAFKTFETTAKEMNQLQQRLSSAYEDVAQTLGKYFEVG